MRQRRKWLDTERRGPKVGPQCAEPRSLQGRHLLAVKVSSADIFGKDRLREPRNPFPIQKGFFLLQDSELCPLPSVSSLTFTSRDPYNFLITWQSPDTNMTGLRGFIVAYHRLDKNDQVYRWIIFTKDHGNIEIHLSG